MLNLKVSLGAEAWPSLIFGNNFNLINETFLEILQKVSKYSAIHLFQFGKWFGQESEVIVKPSQTFKLELLVKSSILDIWMGCD